MTKFANKRDSVLTDTERAESARKCIRLLEAGDGSLGTMLRRSSRDYAFFKEQQGYMKWANYAPTEPQLQWLRDLVSKYVTN